MFPQYKLKVGHNPGGQGVVGSNPAAPTKFPNIINALHRYRKTGGGAFRERKRLRVSCSEQKVPKKSRRATPLKATAPTA